MNWHSLYDRVRFWDSRSWKRVRCQGENCMHCANGWRKVY